MFERDSRASRTQSPLWWMDISARDERHKRRLIIEPYAMRQSPYPAELRVWVEVDTPQYCYVTKSITAKPKGIPTFRIEPVVNESSRWTVRSKTGLEAVVIEALATHQLTGDSAKSALHNLFWTHFVLDDGGLSWLYKHASRETGNFYAGQRLNEYVQTYAKGNHETYAVQRTVEDVMKHDRELGSRMAQRVADDEAFLHAIEALLMTDEDEDIQHANVRRIVELNTTDKDLVLASIVCASRGDHALRGLRACQRAECDPEFFEAIATIARRERTPSVRSKCINAFLHKSKVKP